MAPRWAPNCQVPVDTGDRQTKQNNSVRNATVVSRRKGGFDENKLLTTGVLRDGIVEDLCKLLEGRQGL